MLQALNGFLNSLWRERQLYYRVGSQVHFISLSPWVQAVFLAGLFGISIWLAYTSVNLLFKNEIIRAKNQQIVELRGGFQSRLIDADNTLDALARTLSDTESVFDETTRRLKDRQDMVEDLFAQRQRLGFTLDQISVAATSGARAEAEQPSADITLRPDLRDPQPRRALPRPQLNDEILDAADDREAHLRTEGRQRLRAALDLAGQQDQAVFTLERDLAWTSQILLTASNAMDLSKPVRRMTRAVGGPFEPGESGENAIEDRAATGRDTFDDLAERLQARLALLRQKGAYFEGLPIAAPMTGDFRVTDDFGWRSDPFNRRRAFHGGTDFGAGWAHPVLAAAPGVVTYAGWRGPYGRCVDIDHGQGFITRYAHLNSFNVRTGDVVAFHQKIGEMGSSGRSTGPHLHYEVRYAGQRRDPNQQFKAARYVVQK